MDSFQKNPGLWIAMGLLAFSIFSHYRTGKQFERACIHAEALFQGMPVDRVFSDPDARALQRICEERLAEPAPNDD